MAVDSDGIPAKAIEALVSGGDADDIRATLFDAVAGGIETYGTTSGTVVDDQGNSHTIKFSRPTEVDVYVAIELKVVAETYPVDGDDQVKAAIVNYWNGVKKAGKNVVPSQLSAQAQAISGVDEVVPGAVLVDTVNPPVAAVTLAITSRQVADLDTSRITVTTSPASP